jgi:hypothetical protein
MATAVRFTWGSTTVNFSDEEIRAVRYGLGKEMAVMNNQTGPPNIYALSGVMGELMVEIAETARDTKSRINQVIGAEQELTCYYQYAYAPATTIDVLLIPDNIRKIYNFGEDAYGVVHRLTFIETALP